MDTGCVPPNSPCHVRYHGQRQRLNDHRSSPCPDFWRNVIHACLHHFVGRIPLCLHRQCRLWHHGAKQKTRDKLTRDAPGTEHTCLVQVERGRACLHGDGHCETTAMPVRCVWRHHRCTQRHHLEEFTPCSLTLILMSNMCSAHRCEHVCLVQLRRGLACSLSVQLERSVAPQSASCCTIPSTSIPTVSICVTHGRGQLHA